MRDLLLLFVGNGFSKLHGIAKAKGIWYSV